MIEKRFKTMASFDANHPNKLYLPGDGVSSDGFRNKFLAVFEEAFHALQKVKMFPYVEVTEDEIGAACETLNRIGNFINDFQRRACYEGDAIRHGIEWKGTEETEEQEETGIA